MNVKILRYKAFLGLSALDLDLDLMRHAGKVRFGFRLVVFSLYVALQGLLVSCSRSPQKTLDFGSLFSGGGERHIPIHLLFIAE